MKDSHTGEAHLLTLVSSCTLDGNKVSEIYSYYDTEDVEFMVLVNKCHQNLGHCSAYLASAWFCSQFGTSNNLLPRFSTVMTINCRLQFVCIFRTTSGSLFFFIEPFCPLFEGYKNRRGPGFGGERMFRCSTTRVPNLVRDGLHRFRAPLLTTKIHQKSRISNIS
jgi:hypothetical protein